MELPAIHGDDGGSQSAGATDQVVERIAAREQQENSTIEQFRPLAEIYVQDLQAQDTSAPAPARDHYLLGRADFSRETVSPLFAVAPASKLSGPPPWRGPLAHLSQPFRTSYAPKMLLSMAFVDRADFNPAHYHFAYIEKEFLGDVECLVFDVTPLLNAEAGRFQGRIWVEEQGFTIVRFKGIKTPATRAKFEGELDSWRANLAPGIWLPICISAQSGKSASSGLKQDLQILFWGYDPAGPTRDQPPEGEALANPEARRHRTAEDAVLLHLQRAGLLAPAGEIDALLSSIIQNLAVPNGLPREPQRCRILLSSTLELLSIGRTIVISRGLLDVIPDEATLAAVLARQMASTITGESVTSLAGVRTGQSVSMLTVLRGLPPPNRTRSSEADARARELLRNSPYAGSLGQAQNFLKQLIQKQEILTSLINPELAAHAHFLDRLPATGSESLNPISFSALPMGSRVRVDQWSDAAELLKSRPVDDSQAVEIADQGFQIKSTAPRLLIAPEPKPEREIVTPPVKAEPPIYKNGASPPLRYVGTTRSGGGLPKAVKARMGHLSQRPQTMSLERYPGLDAPTTVKPQQDFAVTVLLAENKMSLESRVDSDLKTPSGALKIAVPTTPDQRWNIDAALSAPGFDFTRGSNVGQLVLSAEGDAQPAVFWLRSAQSTPAGSVELVVTLWYRGSYLGRVSRTIRISDAPDQTPGANVPVAAAAPVAEPAARSTAAPPLSLDPDDSPADLTITIREHGVREGTMEVQVAGRGLPPALPVTVDLPAQTQRWLNLQYRELAIRSGKAAQTADSGSPGPDDFFRGFGRELWNRFAPEPVKTAFWKLIDLRGSRFRSIWIISDDPTVPWELMRPQRGTTERDYLGLDFRIARWVPSDDPAALQKPPQRDTLGDVYVLAPNYGPSLALPGQQRELSTLDGMNAHRIAPGSISAVRDLARQWPSGLIHFSGHGVVAPEGGFANYEIVLEDGVLDLMTWRGMVNAQAEGHPFFFFNACEVGSAQFTVNFVDGWAPELLSEGASGYIGALWPVNDTIASELAAEFYKELESRGKNSFVPIAEVLRSAKRAIYEKTHAATPLGYILYGDPNQEIRLSGH